MENGIVQITLRDQLVMHSVRYDRKLGIMLARLPRPLQKYGQAKLASISSAVGSELNTIVLGVSSLMSGYQTSSSLVRACSAGELTSRKPRFRFFSYSAA